MVVVRGAGPDQILESGAVSSGPAAHAEIVVSCVIVAFHRPEGVARLVESLRDPRIEVLVVNVECDPQVAAAAAGARVVDLDRNPGYAAAVNYGVHRASAPVTIFMNDDVRVDASSVIDLAKIVRSSAADVAVPATIDTHGQQELTVCALPTP